MSSTVASVQRVLCFQNTTRDDGHHSGRVAVTDCLDGSVAVQPTGNPISHSQSSGWTRVPKISGRGCPRVAPFEPVNLVWERKPGDLQSRATTVGKGEQAPADMRRTKIESRQVKSGAVPASAVQTCPHRFFPSRMAGRLLHHDPFRIELTSESEHVGPQGFATALAVNGTPHAGFLAGGSSGKKVSSTPNGIECPDVIVYSQVRKFIL